MYIGDSGNPSTKVFVIMTSCTLTSHRRYKGKHKGKHKGKYKGKHKGKPKENTKEIKGNQEKTSIKKIRGVQVYCRPQMGGDVNF